MVKHYMPTFKCSIWVFCLVHISVYFDIVEGNDCVMCPIVYFSLLTRNSNQSLILEWMSSCVTCVTSYSNRWLYAGCGGRFGRRHNVSMEALFDEGVRRATDKSEDMDGVLSA